MEPNLNLLDCFTGDTTAGEVRAHLDATGQRIVQDGSGKLTLVTKQQGNQGGYENPVLETRRQRALVVLGDRYLLHPSNRVQREPIPISGSDHA